MYRPRKLLTAMVMRVGRGSVAPSPWNSMAKVGMTFQRMTTTTPMAMVMTATG